jgi:addiction module HigA family antidote
MSAYRDALTKMFLRGAFPGSAPTRVRSFVTPPRDERQRPAPERKEKLPRRSVAPSFSIETPLSGPAAAASPHPGRLLAERLAAHRLTASDLARDIGVPVNRVTAVINGQRGITADTALRFGHWFAEPAESWMDAQQKFELSRARAAASDAIGRLPRLADRRA